MVVRATRERLVEKGFFAEIFKPALASMIDAANPLLAPKEKRADSYPSEYKKAVPGQTDAILHLGCVASFQDVKIIPSIMQIPDKAGVNYGSLGQEESCCGYLAYLVGDMPTFNRAREMYTERMAKSSPKSLLPLVQGV